MRYVTLEWPLIMNMGSTVGRNVKNIMCQYDVLTKMCRETYSAVKTFIAISCNNNVSVDNKTYANIIAESIRDIRGNTMKHNDAYDIILY